MYHYYYNLPSSFANVFKTVASMHSYNTRLASKSTYYINTIKTNYGEFNIRFAAVKVWNHLDETLFLTVGDISGVWIAFGSAAMSCFLLNLP